MRTGFIIFTIVFVLLSNIAAPEGRAQGVKTANPVNQAYSNLGVDMQYYEIKYDPNNEDYISYYKAIRAKIMQKLKGLYRYHYRNGDIHLLFTIKSDGTLAGFDVDYTNSAKDKTLLNIATSSLKKASPFPSFPNGLSLPEVSFSVVISFRDK